MEADLLTTIAPSLGPSGAVAALALWMLVKERRVARSNHNPSDHDLLQSILAELQTLNRRMEDVWNEVREQRR